MNWLQHFLLARAGCKLLLCILSRRDTILPRFSLVLLVLLTRHTSLTSRDCTAWTSHRASQWLIHDIWLWTVCVQPAFLLSQWLSAFFFCKSLLNTAPPSTLQQLKASSENVSCGTNCVSGSSSSVLFITSALCQCFNRSVSEFDLLLVHPPQLESHHFIVTGQLLQKISISLMILWSAILKGTVRKLRSCAVMIMHVLCTRSPLAVGRCLWLIRAVHSHSSWPRDVLHCKSTSSQNPDPYCVCLHTETNLNFHICNCLFVHTGWCPHTSVHMRAFPFSPMCLWVQLSIFTMWFTYG